METIWDLRLAWQEFSAGLSAWAKEFLGNLFLAALILFCGWQLARLAGRLTKKAMSKGPLDPLAASFVGSM